MNQDVSISIVGLFKNPIYWFFFFACNPPHLRDIHTFLSTEHGQSILRL